MAKKILLADDSITIQKVVQITLADGDYNLIKVDNGNDAMNKVKSEKPDLVLLDVVMPGKNGYQVCEEIKKNPETANIPVILLAGSFEGFDEIKGAEIGADGYIIKPFESQTLIGKVEEMLNRSKPKRPTPEPVAQTKTQPVEPPRQAVAPEPAAPVSEEVKDFMDSLSSEMDKPAAAKPVEPAPVAEATPVGPAMAVEMAAEVADAEAVMEGEAAVAEAVVEPAQEAEQLWGEAEMVTGETNEPVAEAEMVSEEQLWEQPPMESDDISAGESVAEAEAVSAEPVGEEAVLETEPIAEAVAEPEMFAEPMAEAVAEPEMFAEPVAEEAPVLESYPTVEAVPVAEAIPESELVSEPEPAVAEFALEAEAAGEPMMETVPVAEPIGEPGMLGEEMAMAAEPLAPEVNLKGIETRAQAAAEEIASAVQGGLSHEELVALIRETVERVAWEVVPELAETLIKERISRWEAQTQ